MGKSKPFIDRKSAKHFHLVHRSLRDPLSYEVESSERVLQEFVPHNLRDKVQIAVGGEPVSDSEDEIRPKNKAEISRVSPVEAEKKQETENEDLGVAARYGIFFDDQNEYNYMQHLKEVGRSPSAVLLEAPTSKSKPSKKLDKDAFLKDEETPAPELIDAGKKKSVRFALPEDVMASKQEITQDQMYAMVDGDQQQLILDPDVIEIMQALEDEAYQGDFGDEFVQELNEECSEDDQEWYDDEQEDSVYSNEAFDQQYSEDESDMYRAPIRKSTGARTALTGLSMTSSAMFRNDKLTLLDDQFDKIMEEYEDSEIGELDEEELAADGKSVEQFDQVLHSFLDRHVVLGKCTNRDVAMREVDELRGLMKDCKLEERDKYETQDGDVVVVSMEPEQKELEWDCETILSTYSNIYNRPRVIGGARKIALSYKTGLPLGVLKPKKMVPAATPEEKEYGSETDEERANLGEARPRNESKEDKKSRKAALKEEKRLRREEKKATKTAFKAELLKQKSK